MALSDYERQMLEELENQLADEDPSFAKTMHSSAMPNARKQFSLRHVVLGLLLVAVGISLLVLGMRLEIIPLGVGGVAVIFAGLWYVDSGVQEVSVDAVKNTASNTRSASAGGMSDFMARQSERWQRRQDER